MKFNLLFLASFLILLFSCDDNSTNSDSNKLAYQVAGSYYVGNNVEDGELFLIIDNYNDFEEIFHHFGNPKDTVRIYPSDFDSKDIISVIKPKSGYEYEFSIETIELIDNTLKFKYNSLITDTLSFTMRYNLLVKVQKSDFNSIEFYENGELIKILEKN